MNVVAVDPTPSPLEPDVKQAIAFFAALYPASRGENIHFRGVAEPADGRTQQNSHYALDENFTANLHGFLEWCAVEQRAAFFLPGTVRGQGTGKADVLSLPAVLIDFDKGNPDANLADVEALIGPATIVVESGGHTETGPKLHAYWRLAEPATLAEVDTVCRVREALARVYGGDPAFKQPAQVIRVPGSIHFKSTPKLVQLRRIRPEAGYPLALLVSSLAGIYTAKEEPKNNPFDLNAYKPNTNDMERVLTQPVHEGGVDDITRFEAAGKAIGHYIRLVREGRLTPDDCWVAVQGWNQANMVPPWDEARLRKDFERLVHADIIARGPLVQVAAVQQAAPDGWSVGAWRSDRFSGPAPDRRWLVEGLVPLATAGVFAAVGDAGKSMLALQLALNIATGPARTGTAFDAVNDPKFFGQSVLARGSAVVLTAEDDEAEVHRRLNGLDPEFQRSNAPLYVVPMLAAGGTQSILVDGPSGPVRTQFWDTLKAQLLAVPDLKLVVLDPLSSFVSADINKDNVAGAHLMGMLGELAVQSGAAIMLVHHFAKATVPTGLADARGSIRGAGSLVDNGRWSLVLWEADQDGAYSVLKSLDQQERARQSGIVYLGGLAKGNAPGSKTLRTLVRNASVGVLEDVTERLASAAPRADEVDDAIHRALVAHKAERPRWTFPIGKSSIPKHIEPVLLRHKVDVSARVAEACLRRLLERGLVVESDKAGQYEPAMPD